MRRLKSSPHEGDSYEIVFKTQRVAEEQIFLQLSQKCSPCGGAADKAGKRLKIPSKHFVA